MHWTRILPALAMLVLLGAGMASAQTVLRIGLNDDPDALDPTISRAYVGRLVFAALCDKLFDVTPDLKIVPQLATGYEWAAGGRSVVIRLRPGVKFHDGEPFNAEAVRFNIERHLSTPGSFSKSEIGEIKTVDIVNDLTVRFNLAEPLVPLIAALTDRSGMMVSPKAARELGDKFGTRPVCAGPFKFVERVAQGKIVGERFAEYWDKANIHVDRIEFVPITDSTLTVPPETDRQAAALVIQAMLAEAGITMTIQTQENVTMLSAGRKGDFEAYFTFWSGRPDPDGNIFAFTTCSGGQNDSKYCNQDVDAILTKARHEADPAERKKLYDQTTEIMLRDLPRLILWHRRVFTGLSGRVQGFTPYPDGIIRFKGLKLS